jgi:Domain of unknown function (DUF4133)
MNNPYTINKGINKPIEFKGLKAQYITYLAIGLVALLIIFALLYISGLPAYMCITVVLVSGSFLFSRVYKMSRNYGQYGLLKKTAIRHLPEYLICRTRRHFIQLTSK